jgi:hypothetical protein
VSISPTFYEQLLCAKVFCAAFMCLQFGFVIFWRKDFGTKAAHKILVKLTPGSQRKRWVCGHEFWLKNWFKSQLKLVSIFNLLFRSSSVFDFYQFY